MDRMFSVTVHGEYAGKVLVQRRGLYYHFFCKCCLHDGVIYRLIVSCGTTRENLGIPVPKDGHLSLETKLPVKRIGQGDLSFVLIPKEDKFAGTFVPIFPEEPFGYISRLKESFLLIRNGQPGILIDKMQEH